MRRIGNLLRLVAAATALCVAQGGVAEESTTPLVHRGLDFSRAEDFAGLTLDSEDISIGEQNSSLKYRITNPSAQPVAATLTLPFPELDFSDPDTSWSIPAPDPINFIGVSAKIDQKPAPFSLSQAAYLDNRDITQNLRRHGLAFIPIGTFQNGLAALPLDTRAKLATEGLIAEAGTDKSGNAIYTPRWLVRTKGVRKVTLAPGQTITVELRFRTSLGASRDTVLREPLRSEKGLVSEVERHRKDYCLDRAFFGGVDKMVAAGVAAHEPGLLPPPDAAAPAPKASDPFATTTPPTEAAPKPTAPVVVRVFPEANVAKLRERRIVFDLAAGAPAAPIGAFRLLVDKGKPDYLVSFCLDNLKKTSPTLFEMRSSSYTPNGILRILLIGHE